MTTIARNAGLVAAGQAAVKATQLVLAILLVRLMSPEQWNEAAFVLSVYLAGTTIGTLNLHHGIVFFLPRVDADRQRNLVMQNVRLLLGIGAVITLLLTLAAPSFAGGQLGDGAILPWVGVAIALELPAACIGMTLIGLERYAAVAAWDLAGTALILTASIVPVAAGHGVDGLVVGLIVAGACRLAVGLRLVYREMPGSPGGLGRSMLIEQLRYGLPLGATIAVAMLNRLVDKWFIAVFEPSNFGVYAVAAQEIPLLAVLPYAGGAAMVVKLVDAFQHNDSHAALGHWIQLTSAMSVLVAPLGIGLILVAPGLIPTIFGDEFRPGVLSFQIFTAITVHRVAEYGMLLRAAGRTRELLQVAGLTLGANVVLAGLGASIGGMTGSACGTFVASALGWWCALHHIAATLGVGVRRAFPWRRWISAAATASALATAAWGLVAMSDLDGVPRSLTQVALYALLVAPAMRLVAALTPNPTIAAAASAAPMCQSR